MTFVDSVSKGTSFATTLSMLAGWWRRQRDIRRTLYNLDCCGDRQVGQMASDVHLSIAELRQSTRMGKGAAQLLLRRMAALGLSREYLAQREPAVMRDLERLCSTCTTKRRCRAELAREPQDSVWREHCPNAHTLAALTAEAPADS